MEVFVVCLGLMALFALAAWIAGRSPRAAAALGLAGTLTSLLALWPAAQTLMGTHLDGITWAWDVPMGSFAIAMDGLSAWFVVAIVTLSVLAGIYSLGYLKPYCRGTGVSPVSATAVPAVSAASANPHGRDAHETHGQDGHATAATPHASQQRSIGGAWCHFNLLIASMLLVVTARNAVLFLAAWEVMSLASFFLVMFDDRSDKVRRAGWTYLVATHMGTAALLVMFFQMGQSAGSMDFAAFAAQPVPAGMSGVVFLLAVVGFGTKAGFMPLHVWLPEAHPAAPSHVSAVMSGVMIKTGIYGLCRVLTLLPAWQEWWGWVLIGVGAASGILGVLYALAQHDLKRLLAYHSVENIGIIALGLGLGVLGQAQGRPLVSVLGFAGALLHVLNHALFKGLLFLGAGRVIQATHCGEIDRLGGLLKRMPLTGATFLVAAVAICGLPPLNGFVSELMIYLGGYNACLQGAGGSTGGSPLGGHGPILGGMIAIAAMAMIGGLAAACFTKAFGVVFLGEPRDAEIAKAHANDGGFWIKLPMVILALLCLGIGLAGPWVLQAAAPAIACLARAETSVATAGFANAGSILWKVSLGSVALIAAIGLLAMLRAWLLRGRSLTKTGTWDCGYVAPTARMQYTASSFAQPITTMFRVLLGLKTHLHRPRGLFPAKAEFSSHADDTFLARIFTPAFAATQWVALRLRFLQHGRLQLYVLYIAMTLLVLMVWKLS